MRAIGGRRGVAATEFALVAPILVLLVLATVDVVQLLRAQLRVEAATLQVAQMASQCDRLTTGDVMAFRQLAQRIIGRFATLSGDGGGLVISAVYSQNGANRVAWQQHLGDPAPTSGAGTAGGTASIGGGFVVPPTQTLFVVELFAVVPQGLTPGRLAHIILSWELSSRVHFLSRVPDSSRLQVSPAQDAAGACTA